MDKSKLLLSSANDVLNDLWKARHDNYNEFNDAKKKIDASKEFVQLCRKSENVTEGYKFIFWALLILTVDKTDAEEHLSLICDFAKMLRITDAEFEDIIHVVKTIYDEATIEYIFKSEKIPSIFKSLLSLYGAPNLEDE